MTAPFFVDLENGGGSVRIDAPSSATSSIRLCWFNPRQFDGEGRVIEESSAMDVYIPRKAAIHLRDVLSLALDNEIKSLIGMV